MRLDEKWEANVALVGLALIIVGLYFSFGVAGAMISFGLACLFFVLVEPPHPDKFDT